MVRIREIIPFYGPTLQVGEDMDPDRMIQRPIQVGSDWHRSDDAQSGAERWLVVDPLAIK